MVKKVGVIDVVLSNALFKSGILFLEMADWIHIFYCIKIRNLMRVNSSFKRKLKIFDFSKIQDFLRFFENPRFSDFSKIRSAEKKS